MLDLILKLCLNAPMEHKGICQAIEIVGSQSLLAEKIGVSPQFVCQMANGTRPIPATLVLKIEDATNGAVTRHDLRADIFGEAPVPEQQVA